jgi:hypothetical protein
MKESFKVSEEYSGDYVSPAMVKESPGGRLTDTIGDDITREPGPDGRPQITLFLTGCKKKLGLNKTNAVTVARVLGDETKTWPGAQLTLYTAPAMNPQTKTIVDGNRILDVRPAPSKPAQVPTAPQVDQLQVQSNGAPAPAQPVMSAPTNAAAPSLPPKGASDIDDALPFVSRDGVF